MSSEDRRVLAFAGFAALCCLPLRALGPPAPPLGNAGSFAVLGGSSVTNSGSTIVTGNLGVSPGNTITGFPPGVVKLGDTFKNDALAKAAHGDAGIAYGELSMGTCVNLLSPVPSQTLPPNTYCISSAALLKGALTLDANNIPGAVWIFRITGALTTDPGSCVLAINGAQPGNVFWQVSTSATLGADSAFVGNLIAHDNITLNSHANAFGRLLALTGTVTLDSNNVTLCSTCNAITLDPTVLSDAMVGSLYGQTIRASGGADPYTYKVILGSLPLGLSLTAGGVLSGAPTESGSFPITVAATDSQGCSGERKYTIVIACPDLTLSPATLPDATACIFYTQTISATGGSGSYDYTFGPLPDGLQTNIPGPGMISGIPTTPSTYTFPVTAKDKITGCIVTRQYTLIVLCHVTISPVTLRAGTACVSYCASITASCGTASYTFSAASGTLPAGLVLSPDGMLCGTPTTPGRYTFTITATDWLGCVGSRRYTIPVGSGPIAISPPALPDGIVGTMYPEQTITANCGTPGYRCQVTAGTLPPGLILANCKISGTPTKDGCFTFSVTVTDANGNTNSIRYTICVTCPFTIIPPELADGGVCVFYKQTLTASCATAPYTCNLSGGLLPAGLTLSNCTISGIPVTAGSSLFTISLTDAISNTANRTYTLMVTGGVALLPATLPTAELGSPYNAIMIASGGTPPYTFSFSGTLPPGLSLNTATGEISGTPTALGTFIFCITVSDANMIPQCTATRCYTIDVIPPLVGGTTLSGWGILVLLILLAGAGLVVIPRGSLE